MRTQVALVEVSSTPSVVVSPVGLVSLLDNPFTAVTGGSTTVKEAFVSQDAEQQTRCHKLRQSCGPCLTRNSH